MSTFLLRDYTTLLVETSLKVVVQSCYVDFQFIISIEKINCNDKNIVVPIFLIKESIQTQCIVVYSCINCGLHNLLFERYKCNLEPENLKTICVHSNYFKLIISPKK